MCFPLPQCSPPHWKKSGFSSDTVLEDKNKQRIFTLFNLAMPFGDWPKFCVPPGLMSEKEAFADQGERDSGTGNLLNIWIYGVLCTSACLNVKCKQQKLGFMSLSLNDCKFSRVLTGQSTPEILSFLCWKYAGDDKHQSAHTAILISWNTMMSNAAINVTWSVFLLKMLRPHFQFTCLPNFDSFVLCWGKLVYCRYPVM